MSFYRIRSLPGLEDLVIEGEYCRNVTQKDNYDCINVLQIINRDVITSRYQIPPGALFIDDRYLVEIDNPSIREYTAETPFGRVLFEGHLQRGILVVDYVQYTNGVSVTVREDHNEKGRTVYTQNYFNEKGPVAMKVVADAMSGLLDLEDLVFSLKDIHSDGDKNGKA